MVNGIECRLSRTFKWNSHTRVPLNPPVDGGVINGNPAFPHHLLKISVADAYRQYQRTAQRMIATSNRCHLNSDVTGSDYVPTTLPRTIYLCNTATCIILRKHTHGIGSTSSQLGDLTHGFWPVLYLNAAHYFSCLYRLVLDKRLDSDHYELATLLDATE